MVQVRYLSDTMTIMRRALQRRNANDPDSSDTVFFQYIQDFIELTMSDDVKVFEQFGTLVFTIDQTNPGAVYTFNEVGASDTFTNISQEAFIQLTTPPNSSLSWNRLRIYQDPGTFFMMWGVNNYNILIPGYPTMMLYYGDTMTFRTIPDQSYTVTIYGYKENRPLINDPNQPLPYAYWMRYIAYGAAVAYARDFNYELNFFNKIQRDFLHERKQLLTRTHNQVKVVKGTPSF